MKSTYSKWELLFHLLYFIVGVSITAVGASVFLLSGTGTDPFGILMQGVARTIGISNGTSHILINAAYILLFLIIDRSYIRIGTFVALVATGPMIDLSSLLLAGLIHPALPYWVRLLCTLLGCALLGFGLSCIISAGMGTGANDIVAVIISDKLHLQFRWIRIAVDASCVAVGYLLGGVVGIGTIICVLLVGPIAQFFRPFAQRVAQKLSSSSTAPI